MDLLASITGEWSDPILIAIFVVLFFSLASAAWPPLLPGGRNPYWKYLWRYGLGKWPTESIPETQRVFWERVGLYGVLAVLICLHVIHMGLLLAEILANSASGLVAAGWLTLGICGLYSFSFFLSFRRLVALKPNALRWTRIFLLSYPLFSLIVPVCVFSLVAFQEHGIFSLQRYSREWPSSHFWGTCILAVPLFLHFSLSSNVKRTWNALQNPQDDERNV